jgi:hypothetical protein
VFVLAGHCVVAGLKYGNVRDIMKPFFCGHSTALAWYDTNVVMTAGGMALLL